MNQSLPKRVSTGASGLDHVLGGGLPARHVYLIEGLPGTGKTTLALQFLLAREADEGPALYITLSQSERELEEIIVSHGFEADAIEIAELSIGDHLQPEGVQTVLQTAEEELSAVLNEIKALIEDRNPARVVIDSLAELNLLSTSPMRLRRSVLGLKNWLADQETTAYLIDGIDEHEKYRSVEPIVHGIVSLDARPPDYGVMQRRLKISKMRGVSFVEGWHDVSLVTGGMVVHPRLFPPEKHEDTTGWTMTSGDDTLDELFGGGLPGNGTTLISGGTGAGKSVLASVFMHETARCGRIAAGFLLEEMVEDFTERAGEIGLDPNAAELGGRMRLHHLDPSETTQGMLFDRIIAEVNDGARLIVIDSLTGFLRALTIGNEVTAQFSALLNTLKRRRVATIMTLNDNQHIGPHGKPIDISFLTDNVIRLGLFEMGGEIGRSIWVGKKRYGPHSRAVREFMIEAGGVSIRPIEGSFAATDEKKPGQTP